MVRVLIAQQISGLHGAASSFTESKQQFGALEQFGRVSLESAQENGQPGDALAIILITNHLRRLRSELHEEENCLVAADFAPELPDSAFT